MKTHFLFTRIFLFSFAYGCKWNIEPTYLPCPVVTDVTPRSAKSGDTLRVSVKDMYADFKDTYQIMVGGKPLLKDAIIEFSDNSFVFKVPPGLNPAVQVSVEKLDSLERCEGNTSLVPNQAGRFFYYYKSVSKTIFAGTPDSTDCATCFYNPAGLSIDPTGNIWVADRFHNSVVQLDAQGNRKNTFGRRDTSGCSDVVATSPGAVLLSNPTDLAIDKKGRVYIADRGGSTIRCICDSNNIKVLAGKCKNAEIDTSPADKDCLSTTLSSPSSIERDNDTLWITDGGSIKKLTLTMGMDPCSIRTILPKTVEFIPVSLVISRHRTESGIIFAVDSRGILKSITEQGGQYIIIPSPDRALGAPVALESDGNGVLFIADQALNKISALYPNGIMQDIANVDKPSGIAFDKTQKTLYISGSKKQVIWKIIVE